MPQGQREDFAQLAKGLYLEGLAVDYARGIVWYSDVIAGGVHGVKPDGGIISFNRDRMWTGGIMMNEDGSVLSTGAGGIMWNHPDSGKSGWLLSEIDGTPVNGINEMAPDGSGGIYVEKRDAMIRRIGVAILVAAFVGIAALPLLAACSSPPPPPPPPAPVVAPAPSPEPAPIMRRRQ